MKRWMLVGFVSLIGCSKGFKSTGLESAPSTAPAKTFKFLRGVNLMDLGQGTNPGVFGTDYTTPTLATLQYLASRGHTLVRLPITWERLQPTLGGALDATYLGRVLQAMRDAHTAGLFVTLDLHNYARYGNLGFNDTGGPTPTQFSDVWTRLAAAVESDPAASASLYGYDLMNEPVGMVATPGTLSSPSTVDDFESGIGSWYATDTATSLVTSSRGSQMSADLTAPASAVTATTKYGLRLDTPAWVGDSSKGLTFTADVFVPATTPGTVSAYIFVFGTGHSFNQGSTVGVTKGTVNTLTFTTTAAVLAGSPGMGIVFNVDGNDGSGPMEFYVDVVRQGTLTGAVSAPAIWEQYAQAAVTALRVAGSSSPVVVEGASYASADHWANVHPTAWITDPARNTIYSAHQYGDDDASGNYTNSFATETANALGQGFSSVADRYVKRLTNFKTWLTAQNVSGFIGEYSWPNSASVSASDATQWNAVGETVLSYLDQAELSATAWAAGSWISCAVNVSAFYDLSTSTPTTCSSASVVEAHPAVSN